MWHIIAEQNWEPLGDGFWLNQATELLLASIRPNDPLTLSPNSAQIPPLAGHYRFLVAISQETECMRFILV